MAQIPVKVIERFKDTIPKLQKVIDSAKSRDINEADTVVIVSDILASVFGYDKYSEITREYAIKNNYCDLAIKVDDKVKFLIEVKAIGLTLSDKHYQQALDYGANEGIEWIVLTNGLIWRIYKVRFEKPIATDFVGEFNFLELKTKNQADADKLYILCKEGLKKNAIDEFAEYRLAVNKHFVSAVLQGDSVIDAIKRELKRINPNVKPENEEILAILKNEVIKRDLFDAPESVEALSRYDKIVKKAVKEKEKAAALKKAEAAESVKTGE